MSEITDAMARVGETDAEFGSKVFDLVHRAKWAAQDLWFEAIRRGLPEAVIAQRRSAMVRAEDNRKEYVGMLLHRLSA